MQATLGISPAIAHTEPEENCPFCPGKEEEKWKTFPGAKNSGSTLEKNMENPKRNGFAQSRGARKKDGLDGRQNVDEPPRIKPKPIYENGEYGEFGSQAHHAISGKEILENEPIEKLLVEGSEIEKDTGYNINNCANGVHLPAYPKNYPGGWGAETDTVKKLEVMIPAMDHAGQAHISSHTGHLDLGQEDFHSEYVSTGKELLEEIKDRVMLWSGECFLCKDSSGEPKKPFVPPYKINQYMDNLSDAIIKHLKLPAISWEFFISSYAKEYHKRVCNHKYGHVSLMSKLKANN